MRRRVVMILVFLLIGAAINVTVAWGLAIRPHPRSTLPIPDDQSIRYLRCPWGAEDKFMTIAPGEICIRFQEYMPATYLFVDHVDPKEFVALSPPWSLARSGASPMDLVEGAKGYGEFASGWPMLACRYSWHSFGWASSHPAIVSGAIILPEHRVRDSTKLGSHPDTALRTHLPWIPVWPGFLGNTVAYGFACFALYVLAFALPPAVRRHRRHRRGRCSHCAYDLRGDEHARCPECGEAVPRTICRTEPATTVE